MMEYRLNPLYLTSFRLKSLGNDYEFGVIHEDEYVGNFIIEASDLELIINNLKCLKVSVEGVHDYPLHPLLKIPFYISTRNGKYYTTVYHDGKWLGVKQVSYEVIKELPVILEKILKVNEQKKEFLKQSKGNDLISKKKELLEWFKEEAKRK